MIAWEESWMSQRCRYSNILPAKLCLQEPDGVVFLASCAVAKLALRDQLTAATKMTTTIPTTLHNGTKLILAGDTYPQGTLL